MILSTLDIAILIAFITLIVAFRMWKGGRGKDSKDYFLAGRNLKWYLIGFSIVAANISTEQFVGMAGQGAGSVGLAGRICDGSGCGCLYYFLVRPTVETTSWTRKRVTDVMIRPYSSRLLIS